MKILKTLLKVFIIAAISIAIIIGGIALYMKFYGKKLIEEKLSDVIGRKLKFDSVSLNLDKAAVSFGGFTIPQEIDFEAKTLFNAEKFSLILDREKFEKEKKVIINEILIEKAVLNIERNNKGVFNIAAISSRSSDFSFENFKKERGLAYAEEVAKSSSFPLYNFAKNVKKLTIKNSIINFRDSYIAKKPFLVICKNLNVNVNCSPSEEPSSEAIPMKYSINFRILNEPREASVLVEGNAMVYNEKIDTELTINTENIDMVKFLPYMESKMPFYIYEANFDSNTKIAFHDNDINSLTTMVFHRLKLEVKPGMEGSTFLQVAVDKLAPYLMSGSGEIYFDFTIKGSLEKPEIGIGPKVKYAIGMVVMDELIKQLQKMQK